MRRTKIVATIGPASREPETLRRMVDAGMDVARLNFSHGNRETHAEKKVKVSQVRSRYSEWWLVLEDRIGYGDLDQGEQDELRQMIRRESPWSRIILVNPLKPSLGFVL